MALALGSADPERALALAREALALTLPGESSLGWAQAGDLADRTGDRRAALEYFAKAIDTFHWLGLRLFGTVLVRVACMLAEHAAEAAAVLHGAGHALDRDFTRAPMPSKPNGRRSRRSTPHWEPGAEPSSLHRARP